MPIKGRTHTVIRWTVASLLLLALGCIIQHWTTPPLVPLHTLSVHRSEYHGKAVKVEGVVGSSSERVSRKGNIYHTYNLTSATGYGVSIFAFGPSVVHNGDLVRVGGTYSKLMRVGHAGEQACLHLERA